MPGDCRAFKTKFIIFGQLNQNVSQDPLLVHCGWGGQRKGDIGLCGEGGVLQKMMDDAESKGYPLGYFNFFLVYISHSGI